MVSLNGGDAEERFDRVLAQEPSLWEQHPLKFFVTKRRSSIRAQLDGLSSGQSVGFGMVPEGLIILGIAFLGLALLNAIGWIWGIVAGFRGSTLWGCLNLFFYPVTPVIYGFVIRKELGRRSAIWTLFCFLCVVAWIVAAIVRFS
jgi:hypothetical protein